MDFKDYYATLGVAKTATDKEIKQAFRKLARKHHAVRGTGRSRIVSCLQSFHGRTLFTVSVGGQPKYTEGFEPLPGGISHVPFNDSAAAEAAIRDDVCAVIVEPVQGEGGVKPADAAYLRALRRLCDERGSLLIFDEVQCGMGRTGSPFAAQACGVTPDLLTVAKGLAGGFPAGAVLVTCPRSNVWVGAGLPRLSHFYAARVPVAIGTDSLASSPTLSVFDELAEARRIAPDVAPGALLESATRVGAAALGYGHDYGTITPGKRAVFVAVDVPPSVDDVEEYLVGGVPPAAVRVVAGA